MEVPVDYADPDGETLSVALIRKEATSRKDRIGSLLFNFGGPGASGVATRPAYETEYAGLNARYDLVAFDPRGVGGSSGVVCRGDKEQEKALAEVDSTPDTAAEEAAYMRDARSFGAGCARAAGDLLPHLTTSNTARDMDVLRQVLGDDKLHYLGFSYGTQLGAVYAHLFPKNAGRLSAGRGRGPDRRHGGPRPPPDDRVPEGAEQLLPEAGRGPEGGHRARRRRCWSGWTSSRCPRATAGS